jgi:hypothetical protein
MLIILRKHIYINMVRHDQIPKAQRNLEAKYDLVTWLI